MQNRMIPLLAVFLGVLAPFQTASPGESRSYPSFYCTWKSMGEKTKVEPRGFVVFGGEPTLGVPFPEVEVIPGRESDGTLAVQDAQGKWSRGSETLASRIDGKWLSIDLQSLPIRIFFRSSYKKGDALYFARAYYGDLPEEPNEEHQYICRESDIGLPGGAMSGSN